MVEGGLHRDLKNAVLEHLVKGNNYWLEQVVGYTGQRVDVAYISYKRHYLVECESKPGEMRLKAKGRTRNMLPYRNVYLLVMPLKEYHKRDWTTMRGSFDKVYSYDRDLGVLVEEIDLRRFGWVRDLVLNLFTPVLCSSVFSGLTCMVVPRFRRLLYRVRNLTFNPSL